MSSVDNERYDSKSTQDLVSKRSAKKDQYLATEEKIKVAVRIRPFSERELSSNPRECVEVLPGQAQVVVKDEAGGTKGFAYDFVYSSMRRDKASAQAEIFRDLRFFVDNALMGYNSSVFAYGQTGSGKTYTMMGTLKSPGLIPRGCETLFSHIKKKSALKIEVDASYLEIYMDKIYDLLAINESTKKKPGRTGSRKSVRQKKRTKLPIRMNKNEGVYVEGLTTHTVHNFNDIKALMDAGLKNRTIAETGMNRMSSRSHCIFTLTVKTEMRVKSDTALEMVTATINLVDLAGSERVKKAGGLGTRFEELKKINKSLSALGDVISSLSSKDKYVPYKNSVLTTLLKESLGGNSKTVMIATVSPAAENFNESLNTLRYAAKVKRIRTTAIRNLGEQKSVIEASLRQEIGRLKQQLVKRGRGNVDATNQLELALEHAHEQHNRFKQTHEQRVQDMREQLAEMEAKFKKLGFRTTHDLQKNKMMPQLRNISADAVLTGNLIYFIDKPYVLVGAENTDASTEGSELKQPDIVLVNEDDTILHHHAIFEREEYTEVKKRDSSSNMNLKEWKLAFVKCAEDDTGFLNHLKFKRWLSLVIGKEDPDIQTMELSTFENICSTLNADPGKGLSWEQVLLYFGLDDSQKECKEMEIVGIPKEKLQGKNGHQMVKDLKEHILHRYRLTRTYRKGATLCIVFKKGVYESEIRSIESKLKDLLQHTPYSQNLEVRPIEIKEVKYRVSIKNPDPYAANLMIFVNGQRVSHQPILLEHMDKIIFGMKHVFQFINPCEANTDILGIIQKDKRLEGELEEKSQPTTDQPIMDELKKRLLLKLDESTTKVVELESKIHRIEGQARRAMLKMIEKREAFMSMYRDLSAKVQNANTIAMDLGKRVSFQIIVLPYYDPEPQVDSILDRLMVSRLCSMTDPKLHVHMPPDKFDQLMEQQLEYYELAMESVNEDTVLDHLGDDPFLPDSLETLTGEAVFKISLELPDGEFILNIVNSVGEKVGEIFARVMVERLKTGQPKKRVNKTSRMKGRTIEFTLEILGLELLRSQQPVVSSHISYCFIGPNINFVRSIGSGSPSWSHSFKHKEVFTIPGCENVFLKFLGDGIRLRVWTTIPFAPGSLPRPIFFKLHSRQIELTVIHAENQDKFQIKVQTGALIFKLKTQMEKFVNSPPGCIVLHLKDIELENRKTLSDYGVHRAETVYISTRAALPGAPNPVVDSKALRENEPGIRKMLDVLETMPPKTLDENREENRLLRIYLREAIDQITDMRQMRRHKPRRNLLTTKAFVKENSYSAS